MKLEGKYAFPAPPEKVWELFNDPETLQKALPGCDRLEEREPGKFDAFLKIGIAAVKGSYKGKFEIADPEPPHRYRLIGEGSGSPGFVKGDGVIELTSDNNGQGTQIIYQGEVQVGGLIAGIGQRLIRGVARMLMDQFFKNMAKILKSQG